MKKNILIPWVAALLVLGVFYIKWQIPFQRSYIHALALMRQGQFQEARQEFEQIIRQNPAYAAAYANRWFLRWRLGDAQAAEDFVRMRQLHLKDGQLHTPRGIMYGIANNPARAIAFYNQDVESRLAVHILKSEGP